MLKRALYIAAVISLSAIRSYANELTAVVEPQQIQFGDTVRLELSYDGDNAGSLQPNLGVLRQDFSIYSTSTSMQSSYINGVGQQKRVWTLTLMPKREGVLTIPAISAGQYQTSPLEVEVLPSGSAVMQPQAAAAPSAGNGNTQSQTNGNSQSSDFWAELSVAAQTPYVEQELNGSILVYDKKGIQFRSEPYFADTDDWDIKRVGEAQLSEKNGQRVIRFNYAFFPKKSGRLVLPRARIEGVYTEFEDTPVSHSIGGLFKIFDVNLDMSGMFGVQKPVALETKPLTINVKPIPAEYGKDWWLPATGLRLSAKWTDARPVFKVGEAVTREISLIASGVSENQLPELVLVENPAWKQYPEKPQLTTATHNNEFISEAITRVVYIPQRGGEQIIPEISVKWYNLKTDKIETAVIPAEKMYVGGEIASQSAPAISATSNSQAKPADSGLEIGKKSEVSEHQVPDNKTKNWLLGLVIAGAFGAGVIFSFLLTRRKGNTMAETASVADNINQVEKHLKNHDYRALRDSLLEWGKIKFKNEFISNLNDLADKINVEEFREQMQILNGILYAGHSDTLDGSVILNVLKGKRRAQTAKKVSPLPDLYK